MRGRHLLLDRYVRRLWGSRRATVATIFALSAPILIMLTLGVTDFGMTLDSKNNLQQATDAAALAVAAATVANPNTPEATLKADAQALLNADALGGSTTITSFHVCAPVQNDCSNGSTTLTMNTVSMSTSGQAPCTLCIGGGTSTPVNAQTTSVIGFGATMQLNVVMDGSASMIVGATSADVTTISNWVTANWNSVKPGDPPPYSNHTADNPPCAFACHDAGGSTTTTDIMTGLTNAHSAGATTRFDVMISAAQQLVNHVQTEAASNAVYAKNTYVFNIMSFDTALHRYGSSNLNYANALTQIGKVTPGLDTYLSTVMSSLITQVGKNGTGASASSPLKFVILVTDGLQSDRSNNWNCTVSDGRDPAWNYSPTCIGGYDTSINVSQCTQLKNNGVILAVLETPYVPLTGQDPDVQPYEKTVRHTIYPNGPGTPSVISAALQSCASGGYYFQATNSSQIATGFLSLADKFLSESVYLSK
ncbi:MAG: pilus assembly protein [Caulobacteraceae bacterium]|nr:pilus assembly protein [Caulobacteraceae bacterium]